MLHKKLNQKGFSAVEGLLIVIIVLLVGFIGYYVWHTQKNTNDTLNSASKVPQSSPTKATPVKLFKLTNLGVEFKLPDTLSDLHYTVNDKGGYLSVASMESIFKECNGSDLSNPINPSDYSFAALNKYEGTFNQDNGAEETLLKQFDAFNVAISYPNGLQCASNDQAVVDKWVAAKQSAGDAFLKAFQASATEIKQ